MGRHSNFLDPWDEIRRLRALIEQIDRKNVLNNASTDGQIRVHGSGALVLEESAEARAGNYRMNGSGFFVPWGGESRSVNSLMVSINDRAGQGISDAAAAQARADDAWTKADGAASDGSVAGLDARLTTVENLADRLDTWAKATGQVPGIPPYPGGVGG